MDDDIWLLGYFFSVCCEVVVLEGFVDGYCVVMNCGKGGG